MNSTEAATALKLLVDNVKLTRKEYEYYCACIKVLLDASEKGKKR